MAEMWDIGHGFQASTCGPLYEEKRTPSAPILLRNITDIPNTTEVPRGVVRVTAGPHDLAGRLVRWVGLVQEAEVREGEKRLWNGS